jgi:hypothetical protein
MAASRREGGKPDALAALYRLVSEDLERGRAAIMIVGRDVGKIPARI